ncbi:membrane-anchored junction protein [Pelodytes ibericus]
MPMKPFSFPFPETRLFHTAKHVYKFKIRYGTHFNMQVESSPEGISEEIVTSIRAVLANDDKLSPFSTKSFVIFPYKSNWDSASHLRFKHENKSLFPFPYVFTIYIEPRILQDDEPVRLVPSQVTQEPCLPPDVNAHKGGFLKFLTSLIPFQFLFGGRRHR